jgi:hypothetical protein
MAASGGGGGRREVERGTVMVEYERFGRKKTEKGGRMNEDIGWPPSWVTQGMVGSHFLLPFSENVERGWEKRFSERWW